MVGILWEVQRLLPGLGLAYEGDRWTTYVDAASLEIGKGLWPGRVFVRWDQQARGFPDCRSAVLQLRQQLLRRRWEIDQFLGPAQEGDWTPLEQQ